MEPEPKKTGRFGKGNPGKPKGAVTKGSVLIRDMVAQALDNAGGAEYLTERANDPKTMAAFLGLIGKVMPVQVTGADGGAIKHSIKVTFG
jgi:hypothetical protein